MWNSSFSFLKPEKYQKVANDRYLVHRNIIEVLDANDNVTGYTYDELIVNAIEYQLFKEIDAQAEEIAQLKELLNSSN